MSGRVVVDLIHCGSCRIPMAEVAMTAVPDNYKRFNCPGCGCTRFVDRQWLESRYRDRARRE